MRFNYSWRWFGPSDRIQPEQIRQAGASYVVTALHQVPVGDVWTVEDIEERKALIEKAGLHWEVVESLPVSEDIKKRSGDYLHHVENYKSSLRNLARCGIQTVCYNFMPVLDWSRTSLELYNEDGSYTSGFQLHRFAAFDLYILKRDGAADDYTPEVTKEAKEYFEDLSPEQQAELKATILYGLPGSMEAYSLDEFRAILSSYRDIDRQKLKEHLARFLEAIIPVAEACGIKMAIHPDDPPWNLLGLPRIVNSKEDLQEIIEMQPSSSNGITLCSGSLGAGHFNDLPSIAENLAKHIHFLHLRNVVRDKSHNFREDTLLEGEIDIIQMLQVLLREGTRRERAGEQWQLAVRPDHGHQILEDIGKENYPGYNLYGRMKNLAEIKGLVTGLSAFLKSIVYLLLFTALFSCSGPSENSKRERRELKEWILPTGKPERLNAEADRELILADGKDLSFVSLKVCDRDGQVVPTADNPISFSMEGPGEIVATDNGDPTCMTAFSSLHRDAFNGMALDIVKATKGETGTIILKAESPGLEDIYVKIRTK